jgi:hypothetical protein
MISKADVAVLPLRQEWVEAGVSYALRSWAVTFNRLGRKNVYSRLSKIIVGVVAEQAIMAALEKYEISFDSEGMTDWYSVDRYDLGVNGKSVDIKAIFLDRDNKSQVLKLTTAGIMADIPANVNKFTALVPADQFNSPAAKKRAGRDKVYVVPVVDANSIVSESTGRLCHLMWDYQWLKKGDAKDSPRLGRLSIGSAKSGKVRLVGTDAKNSLVVEDVSAGGGDRQTKNDFWQLFSIELLSGKPIDLVVKSQNGRVVERIRGKVGFSIASGSDEPEQNDWMPVGIANGTVYICGFGTDQLLRVKGRKYPRFSKDVLQYSDTLIDNWGVAVQHLKPFKDLGLI